MSTRAELARLAVVAGLLRDHRLEELRLARQRREATQARLAALVAGKAEGVSPVAAAQTALLYQRWVDKARVEINLQLARDTVAWLEAQTGARAAFGRAQVLENLRAKAAASRKMP